MDTIAINLKLHTFDEPEDYLVTELTVNGQPLVNFASYAIDLHELVKSSMVRFSSSLAGAVMLVVRAFHAVSK